MEVRYCPHCCKLSLVKEKTVEEVISSAYILFDSAKAQQKKKEDSYSLWTTIWEYVKNFELESLDWNICMATHDILSG